jgi:hypothetical protein
MRRSTSFRTAAFAAAFAVAALAVAPPIAHAQSNLTPQQIQGQIASGNQAAALSELRTVLAANPHSGVGWYLTAEAQDAAGNEPAARAALANAQAYAPGLPFADPAKAAALQSHINASQTANYAPAPVSAPMPARGGSSLFPLLILLAVGFFVIRMFMRRRRYATAYPPANQAYGPGYGPGGMPYGPGGVGGGIGSGLLGGLAAGAGFAAGERVIDDMMGNRSQNVDQTSFNQPDTEPGPQDDGLIGNPGWDNSSGDDNNSGIDSGTSW